MPRVLSARTVVVSFWLLAFAGALLLSLLAVWHDTLPGDAWLSEWVQARQFPGQRFADAVRTVTDTQVVLVTGAGAVVALWLLGQRSAAVLLAAGLIALPLLQGGVKELVDRPRPDDALVVVRAGASSDSFPAGHVMSPTYLYGFLLYAAWRLRAPPTLRIGVACWSALTLIATGPVNVWLGVHWPSDVVGGYLWGLVLLLPLVFALELSRQRGGQT